jgi:acetaldehyde dehydrogenase (acetylating)
MTTGLDPAMTLGCGGYGGNITSDNISPRHLLNIKRLAYEVTPTVSRWDRMGSAYRPGDTSAGAVTLPSAPPRPPAPAGISADALSRRIDEFLGTRGFRPGADLVAARPQPGADKQSGADKIGIRSRAGGDQAPSGSSSDGNRVAGPDPAPLDFVCEEDVRRAIQAGKKLVVSERAIVTPAARDLGEQYRVFSVAPWRG